MTEQTDRLAEKFSKIVENENVGPHLILLFLIVGGAAAREPTFFCLPALACLLIPSRRWVYCSRMYIAILIEAQIAFVLIGLALWGFATMAVFSGEGLLAVLAGVFLLAPLGLLMMFVSAGFGAARETTVKRMSTRDRLLYDNGTLFLIILAAVLEAIVLGVRSHWPIEIAYIVMVVGCVVMLIAGVVLNKDDAPVAVVPEVSRPTARRDRQTDVIDLEGLTALERIEA